MKFNPETHIIGKVYDLTQENMNALLFEVEKLSNNVIELQTELAKEYATQLHNGIWEDAIMWLQTPNEQFFNEPPQILILNGQGSVVIDFLKIRLSLVKGQAF